MIDFSQFDSLIAMTMYFIDEACFRWNTRKAFRLGRFSDMFGKSIGLVKPNREFVLCEKVA